MEKKIYNYLWHGLFALFFVTESLLANPIPNIRQYRQDDPNWAGVKYDNSQIGETIGRKGCELTCWAMVFTKTAFDNGIKDNSNNPVTYNPQQLNDLLTRENAFVHDENGNTGIDPDKMMDAVQKDSKARDAQGKGIQKKEWYSKDYDPALVLNKDNSEIIRSFIDKNIFLIFRVDLLHIKTLHDGTVIVEDRAANGHSVLVTGYDTATGIFSIVDPLGITSKLGPDLYENRVYEYHMWELVTIPEPSMILLTAFGILFLRKLAH